MTTGMGALYASERTSYPAHGTRIRIPRVYGNDENREKIKVTSLMIRNKDENAYERLSDPIRRRDHFLHERRVLFDPI